VSPLAGALLDRHGRVRLIQLDYVIAALTTFATGWLGFSGQLTAPLLLGIALVGSLTAPLSRSGLRSLIPLLVPERLWARANAIDSNGYVIATLIGPPLAGAMVGLLGGTGALVVVGVVWAVSALVMIGLPDPRAQFASSGRLLRDSLD